MLVDHMLLCSGAMLCFIGSTTVMLAQCRSDPLLVALHASSDAVPLMLVLGVIAVLVGVI